MIDNVIVVLNLQEPMEKRFIVNYVQKTSEQEKSFEDIERNYMQNSMEVQEWKIMNSVLKASKQEKSFDTMKRNYIQSKSFSFHQVILQKMQIKTWKVA